MATTYYATINGQILYETTGGVRTEYIHDALGSVIATTDSTRNVQNTYRWAGYGTQVAKTGTASDPKFLWNGTSGYRATGRGHSSHYVRRRHFSHPESGWTTADVFWATFGPYSCALLRPAGTVDSSGLVPSVTRHALSCFNRDFCPATARIEWQFNVLPTDYTGYLVQKMDWITFELCCTDAHPLRDAPCGCNVDTSVNVATTGHFYEAWLVFLGKVLVPIGKCPPLTNVLDWQAADVNDTWALCHRNSCSYGFQMVFGKLALAFGGDPPPFEGCHDRCSGTLPSSCSLEPLGSDWMAHAWMRLDYACCKGELWCQSTCPEGPCRAPHVSWGGDAGSGQC